MSFKKLSIFVLSFFIITISLADKAAVPTKDSADSTDSGSSESKNFSVNSKKTTETNTPSDLSQPILVTSISPGFTVRLAANNTTGYQWYLADYNPRLVRLLDHQYIPASTKVVGARGLSVWQFQSQQISFAAPQVTQIVFEYRRAWELKPVKKQSVIVLSQQPTKYH